MRLEGWVPGDGTGMGDAWNLLRSLVKRVCPGSTPVKARAMLERVALALISSLRVLVTRRELPAGLWTLWQRLE